MSTQVRGVRRVRLPESPPGSQASGTSFWDLTFTGNHTRCEIASTKPHQQRLLVNEDLLDGAGALLTPPLCHPHVHLDKAFLIQGGKHDAPKQGDFAEAMQLTRDAKASFTFPDVMRRGRRLLRESLRSGVIAARCFVEVDPGVGMLCLDAGIALKQEFAENGLDVQLCIFAQEALCDNDEMQRLFKEAAARVQVDVLGSAPYVEQNDTKGQQNIRFVRDLAIEHHKHLDFHLDYFLEKAKRTLVWDVVEALKEERDWNRENSGKTIVLGHCSRLTSFTKHDWQILRSKIGDLPLGFVGLPTSDLFMMGRPDPTEKNDLEPHQIPGGGERPRGTLQIPQLINQHGFEAAIGINNVGNAFTPWGGCDPLKLASLGIGIYHAATGQEWELLFECVSTRARNIIGMGSSANDQDIEANFILWRNVQEDRSDTTNDPEESLSEQRKTIADLVCDPPDVRGRIVIRNGRVVSQ